MKTRIISFLLLLVVSASFLSCEKESGSQGQGYKIKYVLKATYDNPQDHDGFIDAELTNVALTTPSGGNSVSLNLLTPFSIEWDNYPAGMTVTATGESVLTHVTVTLEIWRNGVLWKQQTVLGSDNYTVVTVTGTLD
jgi:hypothetical protein